MLGNQLLTQWQLLSPWMGAGSIQAPNLDMQQNNQGVFQRGSIGERNRWKRRSCEGFLKISWENKKK